MSVAKPSRINGMWVHPAIVGDVIAFEQHKKDLLSNLRETFERGPRSKPFDENKSSRNLTLFAKWYFEDRTKQRTMHGNDHVKRLRELKDALGSARGVADKAMRDGFVYDLARAWIAATNISPTTTTRTDFGIRITATIKKLVVGLAALETLAGRAADNVPMRRGRPKGTAVLPADYIHGLARVFKESTGRRPSRVEGPFARFVRVFLTALGEGDALSEKYVVEMIKTARTQIRKDPRLWEISAFNS